MSEFSREAANEYLHNWEAAKENPKDISDNFSSLGVLEWQDFLRTQRHEKSLSITVDWTDEYAAKRLKAFLEQKPAGQFRFATIRATEEQKNLAVNVFQSGVKWEKV